MSTFNAIIGYPLGWIMWLCYQIVRNYGVALLLFTLLTKLLLYPMSVKQQKSSVRMAQMKPKMDAIAKVYANNKQKQQEELMKLYEQENYNPFSGCLPLLIQFPILFGMIDVIYNPLKHILRLPKDLISQATQIVQGMEIFNRASPEISIISAVKTDAAPFMGVFGQEMIDKIRNFDLNFLGINLGEQPTFTLSILVLIPILSALTSLLLSLQSMHYMKQQNGGNQGAGATGALMYITPIFSLIFSFSVPAGVSIYWVFSNILSIIQAAYLNKKYNPVEMAQNMKKAEEEEKELQRLEKIEARKKAAEQKQNLEEIDPELAKKAQTQKEKNRQKLAEARKRDAERYGEEYVDVTDEDLL